MVVHPAPGHPSGTLVNALLHHDPQLKNQPSKRPGLVHRLDKETSGVVVVGRSTEAVQALQGLFKRRQVEKIYTALVHGQPNVPSGLIDVPIGRHPSDRQRMAALAEGRPAQTRFQLIATYPHYSLLEINLLTGRTHQIRVHLSWLKHPVVGDTVYGYRKDSLRLGRHFLHAQSLRFKHPQSGQTITVTAPLPPHLKQVLTKIAEV
jgi:23S rRNA pseudouridine1911/1915/1917 synthase